MQPTILVHIGTEKTGSTSLQQGLATHGEALARRGVHVAERDGVPLTHDQTMAILSADPESPEARRFAADLARAQASGKYRHIVLSSEFLNKSDAVAGGGLRAILSGISDDIRIVLYLREPVSLYRSWAQQVLKATDRMPTPDTWRANYREIVDRWRSAFGEDLTILPFQKSTIGPDILVDFLRRFAGIEDADTFRNPKPSNEAECAEVTHLMQRYFSDCYPGAPRRFRTEATRLRRRLHRTASEIGAGSKAVLTPEATRAVLANHADDLLWLKDQGIVFDATDYEALAAGDTLGSPPFGGDFSEIVHVDPAAAELILMRGVKTLAEETAALDKKLQSARTENAALQSDIAARRSRLAALIDRLDYRARAIMASAPIPSDRFRARMRASAERRHRRIYDD